VTFDGEPHFERPFDPEVGSRTLWGKRDLPPITCEIAVSDEVLVPQDEPESVTIRLSARIRSDRDVAIFSADDAIIDLMIGP
jgi:hypothetical protein